MSSKIGFSASPKQRNSSIVNDLILLILGRLRSTNFDSFRVAENQFFEFISVYLSWGLPRASRAKNQYQKNYIINFTLSLIIYIKWNYIIVVNYALI